MRLDCPFGSLLLLRFARFGRIESRFSRAFLFLVAAPMLVPEELLFLSLLGNHILVGAGHTSKFTEPFMPNVFEPFVIFPERA